MTSQRQLLPNGMFRFVLLLALASFHIAIANGQGRDESGLILCGELPVVPHTASNRTGLVDRFNNGWTPSKTLVDAQRNRSNSVLASTDCGGFRIDFEDVLNKSGVGFDDPTPTDHPVLGATTRGDVRRHTLCEVFRYIGSVLEMKGSPDVIVRQSQTDGSGFLAAASPFFTTMGQAKLVGGTVYDFINTGTDPTPEPGNYDAMIIFDFGPWVIGGVERAINDDWNEPSNGRLDLYSIGLHEATHTLGFLSLIGPNGASKIGGAYSIFDRSIYSEAGTPLVDPLTAAFVGMASDITSNTLIYSGHDCQLVPPVYSPSVYSGGSSLSHFDSYRSSTRYVMRPATGGGDDRVYTEEEMQTLCDMGYRLRNSVCSSCAPNSADDTASTIGGVEVCADVLANDYDPDNKPLTIVVGSVILVEGTGVIDVRNNRICFTPPADFTGLVIITYRATNGSREGRPTQLYVWVTRDRSNDRGLDSGLVAYWPYDDLTANDKSGNGNHGVIYSDPVAVPGVCGSAMKFDGVNDYIRVPNSPSLHSMTQMTLSYWMKFYKTGGAGNSIGNGSDDRPQAGGFFTYTGSNEVSHFLGLQPNAVGLRIPYDATAPLDSQQFTHFVFVVSEDTLTYYRNGCLFGKTPRSGWPITRDWDWFIAWSGDLSGDRDFLNGIIDEIRIYNRPLTYSDVQTLYTMCGGRRGLSVEPMLANFGVVTCPQRDTMLTIHLNNLSDIPADAHVSISSGQHYSLVGTSNVTVDSAGIAMLTVRFSPNAGGMHIDTLKIDAGECIGTIAVPLLGQWAPCADSVGSGTDLVLTKIASYTEFYPGDTVTYAMAIWNAGPSVATDVVVYEAMPQGFTPINIMLLGSLATYDSVAGEIHIPELAVGDTVMLTLTGYFDSTAVGTPTNCIEVTGQPDPNFVNNRACAPVTVYPCPRIIGAVQIEGDNHGIPGQLVPRPIRLVEYDSVPSQHVRITIQFDSTFIRLNEGQNIAALLNGTALSGWFIANLTETTGRLSVELRTLDSQRALRTPGVLLNPTFKIFVGEHAHSDLIIRIDLLDRDCAALRVNPADLKLDSTCGLSYRLMEASPTNYTLQQNSPNPFNPSTTIQFSLGLDGPSRMEILNALGQRVALPIDDYMQPGEYVFRWDATTFPSGLYYCRLTSGEWSRIIRMVLVK